MKFCSKCNKQIPDDQALFCPLCGEQLIDNTVNDEAALIEAEDPSASDNFIQSFSSNPKKMIIALVAIVVLFAGGYMGYREYSRTQYLKIYSNALQTVSGINEFLNTSFSDSEKSDHGNVLEFLTENKEKVEKMQKEIETVQVFSDYASKHAALSKYVHLESNVLNRLEDVIKHPVSPESAKNFEDAIKSIDEMDATAKEMADLKYDFSTPAAKLRTAAETMRTHVKRNRKTLLFIDKLTEILRKHDGYDQRYNDFANMTKRGGLQFVIIFDTINNLQGELNSMRNDLQSLHTPSNCVRAKEAFLEMIGAEQNVLESYRAGYSLEMFRNYSQSAAKMREGHQWLQKADQFSRTFLSELSALRSVVMYVPKLKKSSNPPEA